MNHPTQLRHALSASKAQAARLEAQADNLRDTNRNQAVEIKALRASLDAKDKAHAETQAKLEAGNQRIAQINKTIVDLQQRIRDLLYTILCITAAACMLLAFVMIFPAHRGTVPDYAVSIPFVIGAATIMLLIVFEPYRKERKEKYEN